MGRAVAEPHGTGLNERKGDEMLNRMFFLHTLTPMHVGVGQALGVIDLPIMRERSTQLPIVPGSAIKGVLRDELAVTMEPAFQKLRAQIGAVFGPENIGADSTAWAGAVAWGDAHVLALPVRSMAGVLALATSPFVLRRYARDAKFTGRDTPAVPDIPAGRAWIAADDHPCAHKGNGRKMIVLEDLDFEPQVRSEAGAWTEHLKSLLAGVEGGEELARRLVILPDDDYVFLAETATEVRARVRIDEDTRVVKPGALWYEENLPAETLLWGVAAVGPSHMKGAAEDAATVNDWLPAGGKLLIQIGGKHTVGRGLCQWWLA